MQEDWCHEGIRRKSRTGSVKVVWSCGQNGRVAFGEEDSKI